MATSLSHPWDVTPSEAIAIQERLRAQVVTEDRFDAIHTIAGIDVGFENGGEITRAAVVVLSYPQLETLETAVARRPTTFPYIPGLLSFREVPAVLEALAQLASPPDLLMCDGQGLAHPRRFGIACHLGVLVDRPSIGVAKSRLTGKHDPVGENRGDTQPLLAGEAYGAETIGAVLRTRPGTKPLYISVGHRVSLETALKIVIECAPTYRLPEPTRCAHQLASRVGNR